MMSRSGTATRRDRENRKIFGTDTVKKNLKILSIQPALVGRGDETRCCEKDFK